MKKLFHSGIIKQFFEHFLWYRVVVAIFAFTLLLFTPVLFAYYRYRPVYILYQNLAQFNSKDLLFLKADEEYKSQFTDNYYLTPDNVKVQLSMETSPSLKRSPLIWHKDTDLVEVDSAKFSKEEFQSISLPFQYEFLLSLLTDNKIDSETVLLDGRYFWHIELDGALLRDNVHELTRKGLLLLDTKVSSVENECDEGKFQNFKIDNISPSDDLVRNLEFFIDIKTAKLSRIVVPDPRYNQVSMNAQTCDTDPTPVRFFYRTESHSPTTMLINDLVLRDEAFSRDANYVAVYRFILENIWF